MLQALKTCHIRNNALAWALALVALLFIASPIVKTTFALLTDITPTFQNTFVSHAAPNPVENGKFFIEGTKTLDGREWQEGDAFEFLLEVKAPDSEGSSWETLGRSNVEFISDIDASDNESQAEANNIQASSSNEEHSFAFSETLSSFAFDKQGVYSFRLSEIQGNAEGISYDANVHYIDVIVIDSGEGYLTIDKVEVRSDVSERTASLELDAETGIYTVVAPFVNTYTSDVPAKAIFNIEKTVVDSSGGDMTPAGFTFGLFDDEGNLIKESSETLASGEASIIMEYVAEDSGNSFAYVLREIIPVDKIAGMSYDETEFEVTVSVHTASDGSLYATVFDGTTEFEGAYNASFTNAYRPSPALVNFNGKVTLTGRDMVEGEFSFDLFETDSSFIAIDGSEPLNSKTNENDGSFGFDTVSFDKVGTYRYLVVQDASSALEGITYDLSQYCITVEVTDPDTGSLEATVTILKNGEACDRILFENIYTAPVTPDDPDNPDVPEVPEEPVIPDNPVEPENPTEPEDPIKPAEPIEPDDSDNPSTPSVNTKPEDLDQTGDGGWKVVATLSGIAAAALLGAIVALRKLKQCERV